ELHESAHSRVHAQTWLPAAVKKRSISVHLPVHVEEETQPCKEIRRAEGPPGRDGRLTIADLRDEARLRAEAVTHVAVLPPPVDVGVVVHPLKARIVSCHQRSA